MIASSTAEGSMPARRTASRITSAPSCGAVNDERPPRYLPIGVRTADRMTGVALSVICDPRPMLNHRATETQRPDYWGGSDYKLVSVPLWLAVFAGAEPAPRYQPDDPLHSPRTPSYRRVLRESVTPRQ